MIFKKGIYIGAYFQDSKFLSVLDEIREDMKAKFSTVLNILNPEYDPHITIIYSEDIPENNPEGIKFPNRFDISFCGVDVFSYNTNDIKGSAIVIKVESSVAVKLNDRLLKFLNVKPSFDEYCPHITIGLVDGFTPEQVKKIINNRIHLPNGDFNTEGIRFDIEDLT